MDSKRYTGQLKKWNAERGFGFIVASDSGQDVFVHISAFPRDARLPTDGELLTFEVEPDRNGKRSAVRVRRLGDPQPELGRVARAIPRRVDRSSAASHSAGFVQKLIVLLILAALAFYAYGRYTNRVKQIEAPALTAVQSPAPVSLFEGMPPAAARFTCDGRSHCSQMTSCKEAKLFLKNCPSTEMDGDHDGVPCEQQWCTSPFAD